MIRYDGMRYDTILVYETNIYCSINYLFTESEVFTRKSRDLAVLTCTARPRFEIFP